MNAGFPRRSLLVAALLLGPLSSMPLAASFDCTKAATYVETQICSDRALSQLDDEVLEAYKAAQAKGDRQAVRSGHKAWLKELGKCRDGACVKEQLSARVKALKSPVQTAAPTITPTTTPGLPASDLAGLYTLESDRCSIEGELAEEMRKMAPRVPDTILEFCGTIERKFELQKIGNRLRLDFAINDMGYLRTTVNSSKDTIIDKGGIPSHSTGGIAYFENIGGRWIAKTSLQFATDSLGYSQQEKLPICKLELVAEPDSLRLRVLGKAGKDCFTPYLGGPNNAWIDSVAIPRSTREPIAKKKDLLPIPKECYEDERRSLSQEQVDLNLRTTKVLVGVKLLGIDLSGRDLNDIDLRSTLLCGVDLSNARMSHLRLGALNPIESGYGASRSLFLGCNLKGASLEGADYTIWRSNLDGSRIQASLEAASTSIRGAKLEKASVIGNNVDLKNSEVKQSEILCNQCDLTGTLIENSSLSYRGSPTAYDLDGARLVGSTVALDSGASLRSARLEQCQLNGSFNEVDITDAEICGGDFNLSGIEDAIGATSARFQKESCKDAGKNGSKAPGKKNRHSN